MSDNERRKKDGEDVNHNRQRIADAEAGPEKETHGTENSAGGGELNDFKQGIGSEANSHNPSGDNA